MPIISLNRTSNVNSSSIALIFHKKAVYKGVQNIKTRDFDGGSVMTVYIF